jgi:hypothetical protein
MSRNAMAGAVTLCGVGLCMIGGALLMQSGQQAQAAMGSASAAAAVVAAAANAQAGPTVVWYGTERVYEYGAFSRTLVFRAWSDGTIEARPVWYGYHSSSQTCESAFVTECAQWVVVAMANEGYRAAADINADQLVDGIDLASVLGNWGDAPRVPFPPSDCPLNLVNP